MAEENISKGQKAYLKRIVNEFKADAELKFKEIEELKKSLVEGEEGEPSLIDRFEAAEKELLEKQEEIKKIYQKIFVPKIAGQKSLSQSITDFTEEFKKEKKTIVEIKVEFEEYSDELFGYEDDSGGQVKGLKHKVEDQVQKLKDLHTQNQEKQNSLFEEIEKLLRGASTVALAKAYKEHKDSYKVNNYLWMVLFIFSIISMMALSVYIFREANFEIHDMWKGTIGNLPFIGGAIWLAIYASKQRSQNKRLQEEYAFKEDVAKIYYGLKKEVEELDDTNLGAKLKDKIMTILVEAVALNPSVTLESQTHNDKGPILEAINHLKGLVANSK